MKALALLPVLALLTITLAPGPQVSATATCYVQGSLATVSVSFYATSEYSELPVLGSLLAVVNASRGAYVGYRNGVLEVLTPDPPLNVTVTYLAELFEQEGGAYLASFHNPYRTLVVYLPLSAVIVEVSNLTRLRRVGDYYELEFPEGSVRLTYVLVGIKAEGAGVPGWVWAGAIAGAVSGAALAAYALISRLRRLRELEVLDERDRAIIEALKSGPKTPQELIAAADMSKATFYRRIKRLAAMGYVEQVKREGRVYYKLKERG